MNEEGLKKLLNETLDPIKKQLGGIEDRLGGIEDRLGGIEDRLGGIEDRLDDSDTGLTAINRRLDANTAAVVELESTVKGYADAYKTNKANIERLDDRISELEDNAGITPPPELGIQR